jgi:acyl-CoA thioesterase
VPSYSELIDALRTDEETVIATVGDDWKQGRTTYGGLSAALCLEAAARRLPEAPPLRSAQFAFVGPAAGELSARVEVLRQGKSALFANVDLFGEGGLATRGVLTFGAARSSRLAHLDLPAPETPAPEACELFIPEGAGPAFARQFEFRYVTGGRPLSGGPPDFLVWIRHRDVAARSLAAMVALADALPPPALSVFDQFAPISTMTWSMDVLGAAPEDDGWRLMSSRAETIGEGYSAQAMTLWSRDGAPLIAARQTVAVFL